jgi:hypothetical protein
MPQTYVDVDAWQILKKMQEEMVESGIRGATLGDAIRRLKQGYDANMGEQGKNSDSLALA